MKMLLDTEGNFVSPDWLNRWDLVLDRYRRFVVLHCKRCGNQWQVKMLADGRLPESYWKCTDTECFERRSSQLVSFRIM